MRLRRPPSPAAWIRLLAACAPLAFLPISELWAQTQLGGNGNLPPLMLWSPLLAPTSGSPPAAAKQGFSRLVVEADRADVAADGRTPAVLTLRLFDAQGWPVRDGSWAEAEVAEAAGGANTADWVADERQQLSGRLIRAQVFNGIARFRLAGRGSAGPLDIALRGAGEQLRAQINYRASVGGRSDSVPLPAKPFQSSSPAELPDRPQPSAGGEGRLPPLMLWSPRRAPNASSPVEAARQGFSRLLVEADRAEVPADGQTPLVLTLRLLDVQGLPVRDGGWAEAEVAAAVDASEAAHWVADSKQQLNGRLIRAQVFDGVARFKLAGRSRLGPIDISVRGAGEQLQAQINYRASNGAPPVRTAAPPGHMLPVQVPPPVAPLAAVPGTALLAPAGQLREQSRVEPSAEGGRSWELAKIRVEVDRDGLPADGRSRSTVCIQLLDAAGALLRGEQELVVEVGGGGRLLAADSSEPVGGDVARDLEPWPKLRRLVARDGVLTVQLLAPDSAREVPLRVRAGDQVASGSLRYLPHLRPFVAVGIVEGVLSRKRLAADAVQPALLNDGFEYELRSWSRQFASGKGSAAARTALFLKGKVLGNALLTAAYDSDKETRSKLMRDINPDAFYPVYGDASITGFDARSASPLYVRLDHERSYVLWGDFATSEGFARMAGTPDAPLNAMPTRKLGVYSRTLTGLRAHHEDDKLVANAFVSRDASTRLLEQYPLNGTSILPGITRGDALVNSEQVSIVTYDRNLIGRVLSEVPLQRYTDYVFEPFNGRIQLLGLDRNFFDPDGNPRYLRISYEVELGSGTPFWLYGGDVQVNLGGGLTVGGSLVKDENPLSEQALGSVNLGMAFGKRGYAVLELARSQGDAYLQPDGRLSNLPSRQAGESLQAQAGSARRIELVHEGERLAVQLHAQQADESFRNLSSNILPGKADIKASARLKNETGVEPFAEYSKLQDKLLPGDPRRETAGLGVRFGLGDVQLSVEARKVREDAALSGSTTLPPNYGTAFGSSENAGLPENLGTGPGRGSALAPVTQRPLAASKDVDAATLRVSAGYRASEALSLKASIEAGLGQAAGDSHLSASALYSLGEQTRLYGRYDRAEGLGSALSLNQGDRSSVLALGILASPREDGQAYSEYRWRAAESGTLAKQDLQWASGVRQGWAVADGWRLNTSAEYLKMQADSPREALALGAGLDMLGDPKQRVAARLDVRRVGDDRTALGNQSEEQWLNTVTLARRLDPDWTLLARNYLLYTNYRDTALGLPRADAVQHRFQLGAAWRPQGHNRFNALARYEYRSSRDLSGGVQPGGEKYEAHLVSLVADYKPSRPLWTTARLAGLLRRDYVYEIDTSDRFSAVLASGRAIYDLSDRWDLGVMGAYMYEPKRSAHQWAYGVEAGYLLKENLWLSVGFNFSGFNARDLSGGDYLNRGTYMRFRFKFDETLFRGSSSDVNRSLDRPGG